jgi:hypothetical protein
MDQWPEFVTDERDDSHAPHASGELTGWETVIFEVEEAPGSDR